MGCRVVARTMQKIFLSFCERNMESRAHGSKRKADKRYQTLKLIIFQNVHVWVPPLDNGPPRGWGAGARGEQVRQVNNTQRGKEGESLD